MRAVAGAEEEAGGGRPRYLKPNRSRPFRAHWEVWGWDERMVLSPPLSLYLAGFSVS